MNGKSMPILVILVLPLIIVSGVAIPAQDKYTAKLPDGLALSDWRGYEDWQLISSAKTDDRMKVILGNPTIIAAYKSGVPGNGKPFPEGSKIALLHGERQQEVSADWRVGLRPVRL